MGSHWFPQWITLHGPFPLHSQFPINDLSQKVRRTINEAGLAGLGRSLVM